MHRPGDITERNEKDSQRKTFHLFSVRYKTDMKTEGAVSDVDGKK